LLQAKIPEGRMKKERFVIMKERLMIRITNLLYNYLNRKQRFHVKSHLLKILTLIREKRKTNIYHQCHYNYLVKNTLTHYIPQINF
jgi:hypothetical protein